MSDCTCAVSDPKYWTTHYGAVEPASAMEPNWDCPEHFPQQIKDVMRHSADAFRRWADTGRTGDPNPYRSQE